VTDSLIRKLRANKLFSLLSAQQLEGLVRDNPVQNAAAGETVIASGSQLRNYLVLLEGDLETRRSWTDADGKQQESHRDYHGGGDGEVTVLSTAGRGYSAVAKTDVRYLWIDGDRVDTFLGWNQQYARAMQNDPVLGQRMGLVKQVNVFHQLPLQNVQAAFGLMTRRHAEAGETVISQGDKGDNYFVIESGEAEVWRTDPFTDETACVAELGPGDAFGEEALLQNGMRNATVKMTSTGDLLVLNKRDFDEVVQSGLLQEIDSATAKAKVESGEAKWIDCRYDMEYEESRIPGAKLVPLDQFRQRVGELDPDEVYVVYCRSGRRSKAAAFLLGERKIKAYSMTGGIKEWPYEIDDSPID